MLELHEPMGEAIGLALDEGSRMIGAPLPNPRRAKIAPPGFRLFWRGFLLQEAVGRLGGRSV